MAHGILWLKRGTFGPLFVWLKLLFSMAQEGRHWSELLRVARGLTVALDEVEALNFSSAIVKHCCFYGLAFGIPDLAAAATLHSASAFRERTRDCAHGVYCSPSFVCSWRRLAIVYFCESSPTSSALIIADHLH